MKHDSNKAKTQTHAITVTGSHWTLLAFHDVEPVLQFYDLAVSVRVSQDVHSLSCREPRLSLDGFEGDLEGEEEASISNLSRDAIVCFNPQMLPGSPAVRNRTVLSLLSNETQLVTGRRWRQQA